MIARPRSAAGARQQLDDAENAIAVAIMVLRQHAVLFDAFADPAGRAGLLGPFDASDTLAIAKVAGPSFAAARRFIREHDMHRATVLAALAKVKGEKA